MMRVGTVALLTLLAACGQQAQEDAAETDAGNAVAAADPATREVFGADDAAVEDLDAAPRLESLEAVDVASLLGPTLGGCQFVTEAGTTVLAAGAPDDRNATGKGVVSLDGQAIVLDGTEPGGVAAIDAGPALEGSDMRVEVEVGDAEPVSTGIETNSRAATLKVSPATGNAYTLTGDYRCGV